MPKGRRRSEEIEVSGIFGKKKPSEIYEGQDWTYYCMACYTEVKWWQATCQKCGKVFDWSKSIIVGSEDYDADVQRALREVRQKQKRRRRK